MEELGLLNGNSTCYLRDAYSKPKIWWIVNSETSLPSVTLVEPQCSRNCSFSSFLNRLFYFLNWIRVCFILVMLGITANFSSPWCWWTKACTNDSLTLAFFLLDWGSGCCIASSPNLWNISQEQLSHIPSMTKVCIGTKWWVSFQLEYGKTFKLFL